MTEAEIEAEADRIKRRRAFVDKLDSIDPSRDSIEVSAGPVYWVRFDVDPVLWGQIRAMLLDHFDAQNPRPEWAKEAS